MDAVKWYAALCMVKVKLSVCYINCQVIAFVGKKVQHNTFLNLAQDEGRFLASCPEN